MIEQIIRTPRIKEVFPAVSSIFTKMNYDLLVDNNILDFMFYSDYGCKSVSPIVENVLAGDAELSDAKITLLAQMLLARYKHSWDRLIAASQAEYDPLHNYLDEYSEGGSSTEDETDTGSSSETYGETLDTDNTSTRTDNLSHVDSGSYSNSDEGEDADWRYGFNDSDPAPTDSTRNMLESSGTNGNTRTDTGTQTVRDVRDEERSITDTKSDSKVLDNDKTYEKEGYHRGNIGNISTQKLLREEIELWKWKFADAVLQDAADFLTLPLYDLF